MWINDCTLTCASVFVATLFSRKHGEGIHCECRRPMRINIDPPPIDGPFLLQMPHLGNCWPTQRVAAS